jgi:DNA polymerase (family 10)
MDNAKIAECFDEMAELLELRGENMFRVRAYRTGASTIRGLDESVAAILADPHRQLADLPGIGETLAQKTKVLVETGTLPQLEELRQSIPAGVVAMLGVPGLGAKKAMRLHQELAIGSLQELREACEQGRVRGLKGFGEKTEAMILKGLSIAQAAGLRLSWYRASLLAEKIAQHMRGCAAVKKLAWAGSLRRGKETVGDLDLLVVASDRDAAMDRFESFPEVTQRIARGEDKKVSVRVERSFQVDLRLVEPDQFGAALQYFTGSKEHNVHLRKLAQQQGLKINEYGVFRESDQARLGGATEEEIYHAVGLPWIPPELREDRHEFQWAAADKLPRLVAVENIRGDLHMHTSASDGSATIREMADAAIALGLQYIAITDHSKRVSMAHGLDESRLREQWRMIDQLRDEYEGRLVILKGIECDILEEGGMDLADDCLAEADWVLASLHYGQRQSRQQITDRIIGAIENPHVDCVSHPTGRLIDRREPYDVDIDAVMRAAAKHHKLLEINANPARLDLHDVHAAAAKRHGIPLVINTDAHRPDDLGLMMCGINQARRAGLSPDDVANCWPIAKLREWIGPKTASH